MLSCSQQRPHARTVNMMRKARKMSSKNSRPTMLVPSDTKRPFPALNQNRPAVDNPFVFYV